LCDASVDVEAKVGAHTVFHSGASIDEALKAMLPGLFIATDMLLVHVRSVTVLRAEFFLEGMWVVGGVRQEHTNDAVPTTKESFQLTCVVEVVTDKVRSSSQCGVKPDTPVIVHVTVAAFSVWGDTWATGMTVGWEEGVHPQLLVDVGGSTTRNGVDGTHPLEI